QDRTVGLSCAEEIIDRIAFAPWIPRRPQLGAVAADGRPQQRQRPRAEELRLIDPGDAEAFQALDRVCRVILKPAENDQPVAGRGDSVAIEPEAVRQAQLLDLAFDQ